MAVVATHQPDDFAAAQGTLVVEMTDTDVAFDDGRSRDVRVAFRRWSELVYPLIFFVIVASSFPWPCRRTSSQLREIGAGVLWVAALLSSLLALDSLFRSDADDGSLEQLVLSPVSITRHGAREDRGARGSIRSCRWFAWCRYWRCRFVAGRCAADMLAFALLLATPTLSVLVALGAALTVSLRRGGSVVGLLVLPLTGPLLDFRHAGDRPGRQRRAGCGAAVFSRGVGGVRAIARPARDRRGRESRHGVGANMRAASWFHLLGSPPFVYRLAGKLEPMARIHRHRADRVGLVWGLFVAPPDYQQGEVYRIIYIHPSTALHRHDGLRRDGGRGRESVTSGGSSSRMRRP